MRRPRRAFADHGRGGFVAVRSTEVLVSSSYSIVTRKSFGCKAVTRMGDFLAVILLPRRGSSRFALDKAASPRGGGAVWVCPAP